MARVCPECGGSREERVNYGHGNFEIFECSYCSGTGIDPESCERCDESYETFDEDGNRLCGDCAFESMIAKQMDEFFEQE